MSLIHVSSRAAQPPPEVSTGLSNVDRPFGDLDGEFATLCQLTYIIDVVVEGALKEERTKDQAPAEPTIPERQEVDRALTMAEGVLDNIATTSLGGLCTAYFVIGESDVHARAHEIFRTELGLPTPLLNDFDRYTALSALGRGLLVYGKTITAVGRDGLPTDSQAPHSVWYEIIPTSVNALGDRDAGDNLSAFTSQRSAVALE